MAETKKREGYDPVGDPRTGRPPLPAEKERERQPAPEEAVKAEPVDDAIEVVEIGDDDQEGDQFQPGQLVSLKSGGPFMTVSSIDNERVTCKWFGEGDEVHTESFELETLEAADMDQTNEESQSSGR